MVESNGVSVGCRMSKSRSVMVPDTFICPGDSGDCRGRFDCYAWMRGVWCKGEGYHMILSGKTAESYLFGVLLQRH